MTSTNITKTITYEDFFGEDARATQRLLDYFEGEQLEYVKQMLDGSFNGYGKRKEWKKRGIIPRMRNITKAIVEKSGLLFNKPPQFGIVTTPGQPAVVDPTFQEMLENADYLEVMQNIDTYTRLCGSIIVLQQKDIPDNISTVNGQYRYDSTRGDQLLFTLLHQGNTVVKMNKARTKIIELAFLLDDIDIDDIDNDDEDDNQWTYCCITPTNIYEVLVKETLTSRKKETVEEIISDEPNPDGLVPASFFYDTRKPRDGYWTEPAHDLLSLQEMVNLHITDQEFAIAFQKQKTLFITGDMEGDDNNSGDQLIPAAQPGFTEGGALYNDIPFYQTRKQSYLGGLGSIVKLGTDGGGSPGQASFVGPDTKLGELDSIMNGLIQSVANDWSVNLNYGGGGKANSGFQLIVEEMSNLNLREMRGQSMQAALRRLYEITKQLFPGQLTDGYLQAEFAPPSLPVNQLEQEQLWTQRITNNRASVKDYLQIEQNLTDEEADQKMAEILQYNEMMKIAPVPAVKEPSASGGGAATEGITNG